MPLLELAIEQKLKPNSLDFTVNAGKSSQKIAFIEYVVADTENTGVSPVILSGRKIAESVALTGSEQGLFQLSPTEIVLDEEFGLKVARKYVIRFVGYSENRSKLAESTQKIAVFAASPLAPVIVAARSKEAGKSELTLRLPAWSGADVTSARVCLFKDKVGYENDHIDIIEIPVELPSKHASGTLYSLDLSSYVELAEDAHYTAKIAFESEIGFGPFSEAFSFVNVNVPDKVKSVVLEHLNEENVLRLRWKAGEDSKQYGDDLRFHAEIKLAPFEGSVEEIIFASNVLTPVKKEILSLIANEASTFETDLDAVNEYKVPLTSEILSQLVAQFPDRNVVRKLKFKASITSFDGRNESLPVVTPQVKVLRASGVESAASYESSFTISASGTQTRKSGDIIEKEIKVDVRLKSGLTYAAIRDLLTDGLPARVGAPRPTPWAKKVEYKIKLSQSSSEVLVEAPTSTLDFIQEPNVVTTRFLTENAFSKTDKLSLTYWLVDEEGVKSESFLYQESIKLSVPALVYSADEAYTVNAGKVSYSVYAHPGTETDLLSAKFKYRALIRFFPIDEVYTDTANLALMPAGEPNKFTATFTPTISSQVLEVIFQVSESKASGIVSALVEPAAPSPGTRVVVSRLDLSSVANNILLNAFDATVSPSLPSSYKVLLSIPKSTVIETLSVHNNVNISRPIEPKVSASGKSLVVSDNEDSSNEVKVSISAAGLSSLEVPLPTDAGFLKDLAILNKSSLIGSHLFAYLKFPNLAPSEFKVTKKVSRVVDGQEFAAMKETAVTLRDDFGFEGDYEFDQTAIAIRIHRNSNLTEDGTLNIWGIPAEGKATAEGVLRINELISPSKFIKRNQTEDWVLVDLLSTGDAVPFPIAAMLVVLGTGNRSTSFTFKLLESKAPGTIISDLKAKRLLLTASQEPRI